MMDGEVEMTDSAKVTARVVDTIMGGEIVILPETTIAPVAATLTTMVEMMVGTVAGTTIFVEIGDDHMNEIEVTTMIEVEQDRDSLAARQVMQISGIIPTKALT